MRLLKDPSGLSLEKLAHSDDIATKKATEGALNALIAAQLARIDIPILGSEEVKLKIQEVEGHAVFIGDPEKHIGQPVGVRTGLRTATELRQEGVHYFCEELESGAHIHRLRGAFGERVAYALAIIAGRSAHDRGTWTLARKDLVGTD